MPSFGILCAAMFRFERERVLHCYQYRGRQVHIPLLPVSGTASAYICHISKTSVTVPPGYDTMSHSKGVGYGTTAIHETGMDKIAKAQQIENLVNYDG